MFSEDCYKIARRVPRGKVTTYKEIALALDTRAYRAVGSAMRKNPYAPDVPCHRIIRSDGDVGGFARGRNAKIALLRKEGITVQDGKIDMDRFFFSVQ